MTGSPAQPTGPDRWISAIVALALFAAMAVAAAAGGLAGHTPLLWFVLLTLVCVRQRHEGWVITLYLPALILFSLWFTGAAQSITVPFAIGLLIAYLLDPVVDRMEGRLSRSAAIGVLSVPVLALIVLLAVVLIPALIAEGGQLISRLPELQGPLERLGVWAQAQAARLGYEIQPASIADWILPRIEGIGRNLLGAGAGVWKGVQGVIAFVSFLVITPVVATYMLRDIDRIRYGLLDAIPPASRDGVDGFLQQVDRAISGYFRGQLLVGLVSGVIFAVGLTILGMDYALLVGISAVVLNLVPYIGAAVTAVLAVSVGLLSDPSWTSLVKVGGLYLVASAVENVVSPRIMGHSLSLHPVVVMLSLLIAGQFLGLVGLLVAVPAAAVIKESLKVWAPQLMELLPLVRDAATSESES